MSSHLRYIYLKLYRPLTCNIGVKVGGFGSLSQQKVKEIPPNEMLVYLCYQDVVLPMSNDSCNEGFQEGDWMKTMGRVIQY